MVQVYTMVQHVVYQHTHLLYNRHLDQILLSALYGICKVCHEKPSNLLRGPGNRFVRMRYLCWGQTQYDSIDLSMCLVPSVCM